MLLKEDICLVTIVLNVASHLIFIFEDSENIYFLYLQAEQNFDQNQILKVILPIKFSKCYYNYVYWSVIWVDIFVVIESVKPRNWANMCFWGKTEVSSWYSIIRSWKTNIPYVLLYFYINWMCSRWNVL